MTQSHKKMVFRICGGNARGGARAHVYQLNEALENRGIQTMTFIPSPPEPDALSSEYLVPFRYIHQTGFLSLFLWALKHRFQILYIHTHLRRANIWGFFLSTLLFLPHVMTLHGPLHQENESKRERILRLIMKMAMIQARRVIFISHFVKKTVLADLKIRDSQKMGVVYNGSSPFGGNIQKPAAPPLRVCVVGELSQRKGMDDLIWICSKLHLAEVKNIRFLIYGRGEYEKKLKRAKFPFIKLMGYEHQAERIFHHNHLHLILSKTEGFGRVITEAMSFETPTLCYKQGAFPEIMEDGITGILCQSREEIVKILKALALKPKGLDVMGRLARRHFEKNFTVDIFKRSSCEVLDELLPS